MHLPGGRASRGGVPRGDARFLELISVRGGTPTYLRADRDTLCVFSVMPRVCLPCPPKQKRAAYTALGQGVQRPFSAPVWSPPLKCLCPLHPREGAAYRPRPHTGLCLAPAALPWSLPRTGMPLRTFCAGAAPTHPRDSAEESSLTLEAPPEAQLGTRPPLSLGQLRP